MYKSKDGLFIAKFKLANNCDKNVFYALSAITENKSISHRSLGHLYYFFFIVSCPETWSHVSCSTIRNILSI